MWKILEKVREATLNLLYPPHCLGCGESLHRDVDPYLCEGCKTGITFIKNPRCTKCGAGLALYGKTPEDGCIHCQAMRLRFDTALSAVYFQGGVKELIHHFKYNQKEYLVKPLMAFISKALETGLPFPEKPHWIIPVPLHWRKKGQRGFNQAELLARCIGEELGIRVLPKGLSRLRDTRPQTSLSLTQRKENVKGAFQVKAPSEFIRGKTILLVDDVLTTGLTASECARVLKRAGAERVHVLTVARAVGTDHSP
jgi:ComF family protein